MLLAHAPLGGGTGYFFALSASISRIAFLSKLHFAIEFIASASSWGKSPQSTFSGISG
ncbi:hypothetical protein JK226_05600 [Providencia rettgeri]|nr:hypothetical protein [Providencia rettgeri]MBS0872515.1 hypothetical protein [Providencia rettgeri]MBS0919661.1 hypothetical protein [Providencia rettgeri]MCL0015875.1 hypothetical protein [Providencia rettgeri]